VRTMRATAAECLLSFLSQAIRKRLRDRGVGAGVAPEFMTKRNSEPVGIRGRSTADAERPEIGDEQGTSCPVRYTCLAVAARGLHGLARQLVSAGRACGTRRWVGGVADAMDRIARTRRLSPNNAYAGVAT
jgi:hypothetical protein